MMVSFVWLFVIAAVAYQAQFSSALVSLQPQLGNHVVGSRGAVSPKRCRSTILRQSSESEMESLPSQSRNEFSRLVSPDRIRRRSTRDYQLTVTATTEECQALASRFDLKDIATLEASVSIRRRPSSDMSANEPLLVDGSIQAVVTQTCVRTNDDFLVRLEFPLHSVVRPVAPFLMMSSNMGAEVDDVGRHRNESGRRGGKGRGKNNIRGSGGSLDDIDLLEFQRMLEDEEDYMDDEDYLMEDEAIFPTGGKLDVGELVAQLFWLQLDPYPKKPGTGPIQMSISG